MSTSFSILDLVFFTFTIIFVLTAFFRGFVKEIFSLLNWIVSLTLSYLLTPYVTDLLIDHFENRLVLDGITRSLLFILFFIITAISTSGLCDSLQKKIPKIFDRSLGVFFGFVKTLLIFGFIYSLYFNLYGMLLGKKLEEGEKKEPQWLTDSKCYSLLKFSGDTLNPLVKKFFDSITKNLDQVIPKDKNLDEKIDEIMQDKDLLSETKKAEDIAKKASDINADADVGYNKKDIEKMNHLINIIDK